MERPALISKIEIKMDEYIPEGMSLPFDEYIGPVMDEAAREVLEKAPLHLLTALAIPLTGGEPPVSIIEYHNDKAYIPVPSDYVKLYELKYPLWKKSIRRAVSTEESQYKIQENQYIKAGYGRPVVAIVTTSINGGGVKTYFECAKVMDPGEESLTPVALYVKTIKPEELNDILADALTWLCSSKLLGVMGYGDKSVYAMEQYNNTMISLAIT